MQGYRQIDVAFLFEVAPSVASKKDDPGYLWQPFRGHPIQKLTDSAQRLWINRLVAHWTSERPCRHIEALSGGIPP